MLKNSHLIYKKTRKVPQSDSFHVSCLLKKRSVTLFWKKVTDHDSYKSPSSAIEQYPSGEMIK